MPIHIETVADRNLTLFTVEGETSFDEQMTALQQFYENGPTRHVIWDFIAVKGQRLSVLEIEHINAYTQKHMLKRFGGENGVGCDQGDGFRLVPRGFHQVKSEQYLLGYGSVYRHAVRGSLD